MADLQQIVDQLSDLTVIEAAELSKLLEEKWGVSAAAPVAVAAAGAALRPSAETLSALGHGAALLGLPHWPPAPPGSWRVPPSTAMPHAAPAGRGCR